jgi:L-ribulokinase
MQIYANVTGRAIKISRSAQTCALGAAIAAAVAAGKQRHGYPDFQSAQEAMTGQKTKVFKPDTQAHNIYRKLYLLYRTLHDAFGTTSGRGNLHNVMKELIAIRRQVTG